MPSSVLLVDDHQSLRDGIKAILERGGDFQVVGEVGNGVAAIQFCRDFSPDIVVMDLSLPGGLSGIDATVEVLRLRPLTKVVVLSMHDDEQHVLGAVRAGARGFVLKRASLADVVDALRTIAKGGSSFSPDVSDVLLTSFQRGNTDSSPTNSPLGGLSPREVQVMRMVAGGKSSKEVATALGLEVETIRSYRKTMMKKLGVNNVASLTMLALAEGLLSNGLEARI